MKTDRLQEKKKGLRRLAAAVLLFVLTASLLNIAGVGKVSAADKNDSLSHREKFNILLAELHESGEYDELITRWLGEDRGDRFLDYSLLTGENGTVTVCVGTVDPFCYLIDGVRVGFTAELIYRYCLKYGYKVEFMDVSGASNMVLAVQEHRCDFGGCDVSITEERKKSVDFSDPIFENLTMVTVRTEDLGKYKELSDLEGKNAGSTSGNWILMALPTMVDVASMPEYNSMPDLTAALSSGKIDCMVMDEAATKLAIKNYDNLSIAFQVFETDYFGMLFPKEDTEELNVFRRIANSFRNNFLVSGRLNILLKGIGNTLLITFVSVLLGTVLGFLIFILTGKNNPVVGFLGRVIDGLPVVVILLIFYYVVFGNTHVGGVFISTLVFTLLFTNTVIGILSTSVGAIDRGQFEASYALGYSKNEAFFRMIFPQALEIAWPGYQTAILSQIKGTAIVGYIAVQDLTKAGDMVRNMTFDAFFPLLVVALIYFALGGLLTVLVKMIRFRVGPSKRKSDKFLKEVES